MVSARHEPNSSLPKSPVNGTKVSCLQVCGNMWGKMLIAKGKVSTSEPWNILEVAIGQAPDVLAIRLSKELKRIHEAAVEALIPFRRNADGDPEWIVEHVYVRGANGSLSKLASTPGIDFVRKETAEPDWIETLLSQEQDVKSPRFKRGTFVRVLTGPCARLCGNVEESQNGTFSVGIQMRTKRILVRTLAGNLQAVSCPAEQRVFFYQSDLFSA